MNSSRGAAEVEQNMEQTTDREAELQAFVTEIAPTGWRAQITPHPGAAGVCLRIDRQLENVAESASAIEVCRSTFSRAAASARKHIYRTK
jgi:hypothetical protein